MSHAVKLAALGAERAPKCLPDLRAGLNTHYGKIIYPTVAEPLGLPGSVTPFRNAKQP